MSMINSFFQYNDNYTNRFEDNIFRGTRYRWWYGRIARFHAENYGHIHGGGKEGSLRAVLSYSLNPVQEKKT